MILGEAFQRQTRAITETDEKGMCRLSLLKNGRRISVRRLEHSVKKGCSPLLSSMRVSRALRKGDRDFLVKVTFVRDAEEDIEAATAAAAAICAKVSASLEAPELIPDEILEAIKQRFANVLVEELPAGMPPDRGVGHTIPLEPGHRRPYRSICVCVSG